MGNFTFSATKKLFLTVALLGALCIQSFAITITITGGTNTTPNMTGPYATLAAAITGLNTVTSVSGPVTITVSGSGETAPAGGYVINCSGVTGISATNNITIDGGSQTITAATGLTSGALNDAIFKLIGADFITIKNFVMVDNANAAAADLVTATNTKTEWGVALLYKTLTDGAQNNTIQGNTITLNRAYSNTFGIYSNTRHSATAMTTTAEVTSAAGSNSNNKVYGNTISNVNYGIVFIGAGTTIAAIDAGNDIGGSSAATANTITNWGGNVSGATSSYVSLTASNVGIFMNQQINDNVSFNSLTSATNITTLTTTFFYGILKNNSVANPTGTITATYNSNTVTLSNAPTTSQMCGISLQGLTALSTATFSCNSNSILNCAVTGASATLSLMVGIFTAVAPGTLNINNNTIRGFTTTATSGGFTGIQQQTNGVVTALNINNNKIGDATAGAVTLSATSNSGAVAGIAVTSTGAASTCAISITGNDLRGIVHSSAGSGAHTYISNAATSLSQNISSNTFTNLTVNTTGSVTFISDNVTAPAAGSKTINSNSIVTGFSKTGVGGTVALYTDGGSSTCTAGVTNNNNNFSNITLTGATTITGWFNNDGTGATPTKTITGNTFSNWTCGTSAVNVLQINYGSPGSVSTNTITSITGQGVVTGLLVGASGTVSALNIATNTITGLSSTGTGGNVTGISNAVSSTTTANINGNTINTLSSTSTTATVAGITNSVSANIFSNTINTLSCVGTTSGVTNGIMLTGGAAVSIYKNKIYDLSTSGAFTTTPGVNGIVLSGSTSAGTVKVYNNIIGDLRAAASTSTDAIRGLSVTATGTTTTYQLYYNTVYMTGTGGGGNFGTSGLFHATNATSTTAQLDLRNNIIVNNSTPSGTGLAVAYRRSSTTLTNYGASSNNNDLVGTSGLFTDGTNTDAALGTYQTRVSTRDAATISVSPVFLSTTGSNANFLHIDGTSTTNATIDQGATPIATYTDDFDANTRCASACSSPNLPDIGADEFTYAPPACSGTPIAGSITGNTPSICGSGSKTLSLTGGTSGLNITYAWAWGPTSGTYPNAGGTAATEATGTISATRFYIVTVTCTTIGGGSATATATVTVNPLPTVSVTPSAPATCGAGAAVMTASGASTYVWSPTTNLLPVSGTAAQESATPTATTTYNVTGTNANGCTASATVSVSVAAAASATASASPATLCAGGNSTLTATGSQVLGYSVSSITYAPVSAVSPTFLVTNGVANVNPVGGATDLDDGRWAAITLPFSFTYLGSTISTVSIGTNGVLMFNSAAYAEGGYNNTLPSINDPDGIFAAMFADFDLRVYAGYTNSVTYETQGTSPNRKFIVSFNHAGFYNSGLTPTAFATFQAIINEDGSLETHVAQITETVTAKAIGLEDFAGATALVPASRNNATNWGMVGNEAYKFAPTFATASSYQWSPSTYGVTNVASPTATNVTATQAYNVTVTMSTGCTATATTTVTIAAGSLSASASATVNPVCAGSATQLQVTPTGGCPPYTYSWANPSASVIGSTQNVNITPSSSGSGTYTVTVWDNGNVNSATAGVNLTVNTTTASISPNPVNATICGSGSVVLTASGTGGTLSYSWSNGVLVAGNTVSPTSTTTYTVTVTANTCTATASQAVTVNPFGATVTVNPATITTCAGTDVPIVATATTFTTQTFTNASSVTINDLTTASPYPAAISVSGLPTSGVTVSSITINGVNHTFPSDIDALIQSPTAQTIGIMSDAGNGTDATGQVYTFSDAAAAAMVTSGLNATGTYKPTNAGTIGGADDNWPSPGPGSAYTPTVTTLAGFTGNMNGSWGLYVSDDASGDFGTISGGWSITFKVPVTTGFTYAWNPTSGLTPSAGTSANETANVATNTTYTVTATASNGCSATGTSAITISSSALAGAPTATPAAVCVGSTSVLDPHASGGCPPYSYAWSDGLGSGATATATVSTATTYHVTVSDAGAVHTSVVDIPVTTNPSPSVNVTTNPANSAICGSGNVIMTANGSGGTGSLTYTWSPTTALQPVAGTAAIETATPTSTTVYTVTVKDANNCTGTATKSVNVSGALSIPTISATEASICSGGTSQLLAAAVQAPSSQTANTYIFTTSSGGGTLASMTGATDIISTSTDDAPSSVQTMPAGFSFTYEGTPYTQFSVSPDGWLKLGSGAASAQFTNNVTSGTNTPKLYPLWDDLNTGVDGKIQAKMFGTAPNRHYVIQWQLTVPRVVGGNFNSTFQLWLYETTNVIELRYGTVGTPFSASVGITGATSTKFQSVTVGSNTSSSATANNTNATAPGSGRLYRFTPPSVATTYSYNWSNPGGFLSATNIDNPQAQNVTTSETYTVTATSGLGCTATATTTVTVAPLTVSAISANPASVCSGAPTTISATATGGGTPYTYAWSSGQTTASFTGNPTVNPTIYTVTVNDNCGGSATASVSVTVNPLPTPSITPTGGGVICGGTGTKVLTAGGGGTYLWSTTATTAAITTPTITANTTYTVTVTAANTCTASTSYTVTVSAAINVATPTANPNPVCTNSNSNLNVVVSTVNPAYTQAVITHNPIPVPGGATVLVDDVTTATLASGDLDDGRWNVSLPFTFTFNGTPYSTVSVGTNGNLMFGATVSNVGYNNTLPSATDPDDFVAGVFGDFDMSVLGSGDITYFTTGVTPNQKFVVDFSNTYFYTSGTAGSVGLASFQMILNENGNTIEVHTTNVTNTTINKAQGVELVGTVATVVSGRNNTSTWTGVPNAVRFSPPVDPVFTYAWTNVGGYLNNTAIHNPIAQVVAATTVYTVTATDPNGCTASSPNLTLNTLSLPSPLAASNDGPYCVGTTINLNATPNSATSYAWSGPGTFTAATQAASNGAATLAKAGTYTVTVTGTNGCSASISTSVSVTTAPTANAGAASVNICSNSPYTVTGASTTNNASVNWTHNGAGNLTNTTTLAPTYTPAVGESGAVILVLHSLGNGPCPETTDSKVLNITPAPTVTITAPTGATTCSNTPFTVNDASATNYASLNWTDNGTGSFTANQAALNPTYTPNINQSGTVTLTLHVTANGTCANITATKDVVITTAPTANAGAATGSICNNLPFNVTGASATNNSGVNWTHNGAGTLTNGNTLAPTYTPALGETGTVTLVLHSLGNGPCAETTDNLVLTINPRPTFTTTQTNVSCFGGTNGTITVTTTLGTSPFDFSKNGGTNYASNQVSPYTFTALAATSYSVVVRDNNGCVSLPQTVTVVQPIAAVVTTATNTGPYSAGQTISLTAGPSGGTPGYGYSWSGPGAYTSTTGPTTTRLNSTTAMSGIYRVTTTDANGCSASAQTTVNVFAGTVWTGAVSTDWHSASNWSPTNVPDQCSENVVITNVANKPIVSTVVNVGNVTINAGGQITLNANLGVCGNWIGGSGAVVLGNSSVVLNGSIAQTIAGTTKFTNVRLDNTLGATVIGGTSQIKNALELKTGVLTVNNPAYLTFTSSSATQCAIIDNFSVGFTGSISGQVKMQRFYNAPTSPSFKTQHYMGSPANQPLFTQFGASGVEGYIINTKCDEKTSSSGSPYGNVAKYDENAPGAATCDLQGWYIVKSGNAENGRGYSVSKSGAGTLTITGAPNQVTSYTRTGLTNSGWSNTTFQGHTDTSGWHILSNPWLANLELNVSGGAGMDNQVAVWQTTGPYAGGYRYYQQGFDVIDIAPFQAFLVHKTVAGGTATYTINGADRVRTPSNILFQSQSNDQELAINVDNTSGLRDRTVVAFNTAATNSFDPIYDGNKLWGDPDRQTLYTENNGMPMARNTLNSINTTSTVSMGFGAGLPGNFTMSFEGINTFDATSYITLEDRKTNIWHDVRSGNYTFTGDTTDSRTRFVLHFTAPAQITKTDATCSTQGTINVTQPGTVNWSYNITNSNAVAVSSGSLNASNPISLNVPVGVYTITLIDNNNYTVVKQVQVNGAQQVTATFNASATTVEQDADVTFTSTSTNATNNAWNFGDNTTVNGNTTIHSYTTPGTYNATLTSDNSDCNATSTQQITVTAKAATGINNVTDSKSIAIWSSDNTVYVDMSKQPKVEATIEIYNVLGQQLSNEKFGRLSIYTKQFTNLEAAYVIVRVKNNDEIITKKLFVGNSK